MPNAMRTAQTPFANAFPNTMEIHMTVVDRNVSETRTAP